MKYRNRRQNTGQPDFRHRLSEIIGTDTKTDTKGVKTGIIGL
jgi:hypothetical protein